jgi:hypothetical protein
VTIGDDDNLTIDATINLNCSDLADLIEDGTAACGFFLVCRRTYQNRLIRMNPGTATHRLDAPHFFGTIQLRPVVWSETARHHWKSDHLHPEYGGEADFPAASLLAVGEEQLFSVDRERLKPFESIFSLVAIEDADRGRISVDPEKPKITIGVHPETKASIDEIRNDPRGRIVLLNSVYLPAVMQVLTEMSGGDRSFEEKPWHRIFAAKCAQCGFEPANATSLEHAQLLLRDPFSGIEAAKERLFP